MLVKRFFSILIVAFILHFSPAYAQTTPEELVLKVSDTSAFTSDTGYLSVYMDSYNSDIFGFQFVVKSSRPDLITFDFSGTGFDISNTLVEGFEYVQAIDKAGDQSEYWFRCIADIFGIPGSVPGISPQQGGLVMKIPYITSSTLDTSLSTTSEITFGIPTDFSDPFGNSLGVIPDTLVDTIYYSCTEWNDTTCLNWVVVTDTSHGYDAIVYDSTVIGLLDSTIVLVLDGSITLSKYAPNGTFNCDATSDGALDISDLVCFVSYLFPNGEPFTCEGFICDTNFDSIFDISDLVFIIDYMFTNGPPPPEL